MAIVYLIRHTQPQNEPLVESVPSAVLTHGYTGQLPGAPRTHGHMLIYVCCVQHVFLMLEH